MTRLIVYVSHPVTSWIVLCTWLRNWIFMPLHIPAKRLLKSLRPYAGNKPRDSVIQCVPLATEPGISLIILTPMKILQRNLNRGTLVVWEMKRNVSVVCVYSRCNILISGKIIKEMPGSVASGTRCIYCMQCMQWRIAAASGSWVQQVAK